MRPALPMVLPLALLAAVLAALALGEVALPPVTLWHGLVAGEGPGAFTLRVIRGPRVATALGAGAALGLSGGLFQALFRNPLAAPDLMGFNAGAGLAVLLATAAGLALPMPLVAAAGGLAAAAAVALLAWRPGHATPVLALVLTGLGLGFALSAAASVVMLALPLEQAAEAQRWLTGSLAARGWHHAGQVALLASGLAALTALQMRALGLLELGVPIATGLGLAAGRARLAIAGTATVLAAAAVAVAGPVPFVALMAAPLGQRLSGARRPGARLVAAAVTGALIMVLADLAARAAIPGVQFPIGVMTGLLGAPYLMWRLAREMTEQRL
ncbi:iron chelate uptake ABC transporter family permease subunit [Frigidibacter sp. MR17.24]|uniref:iron chelate uptake ABC transporter family permease subunit n=1 Tax=Frigidibacter sp. MR17.24 TaxID=3127345 RepID=UPI003012CFED